MKKLMKGLYASMKTCIDSMVSIMSVLLFSSFRVNKSFKQLKRKNGNNSDAFILANGPSLKKFLEGRVYPSKGKFAVNYFSLSPFFELVKPDNYIVADQSMCGRAQQEDIEDVNNVYKRISEIDWDMNMFFPSDVYPSIVEKVACNPRVNIIYYNRTPVEGGKRLKRILFKYNLGMPQPQNVTNAAIFCAINAGYRNVYLFGVEHSWTIDLRVNDDNQVCYCEDHFYDNKTMRVVPNTDITSILLAIARGFKSHIQLNEYAKFVGCDIFNATEHSLIDAYQRIKVSDIHFK